MDEGRVFGYVRVSTKEQNEDRQVIAMREFGVAEKNIHLDKQSGKDFERPAYKRLLRRLKPGDVLVIKSIDRLGRDYDETLEQWRIITKDLRAAIVVLDMPLLDTRQKERSLTGTFIADLVLQILSYVAQTEREFNRQRQAEGITAAKEKGVRFGRPPMERPEKFWEVFEQWREKRISGRSAAKAPTCKSTTLQGYMGYFRKYLLPEFGDMNIYDIRPFDIQECFRFIPHLTLKTQKEHFNVLSNLFDYAMDDENVNLPRNPAKSKYVKVKYSESDSVIREPLPSEVISQIIEDIATLPLMERRLMALLLFTGMRRGEVLALRWEDLDFKTKFITVRRNATYAHNQAEITTPPRQQTDIAACLFTLNSLICSVRQRRLDTSSASIRRR